ncbi:MAG: glycosyltransferase family 9 protein [Gemmatimonadota bacterium]|jgi:ADP-heptose:LPS heptosyltransferase
MAGPIKRLERRGRALLIRVLARFLSEKPADPPEWDARPWRALYLRYDRIGDMILSSGLFRALVTAHPTISLDVLASPANRPVLDVNPYVRDTITLDKWDRLGIPRFFRELRRRGYDIVIDPMISKPSLNATLMMLATGAPYRVGLGGRSNAFIYTLPVVAADPREHHIVQEAVMLEPFGIDPSSIDLHPEIFVHDDARKAADEVWRRADAETVPAGDATAERARLLVNVSTHHETRLWPEDRFAEVIRNVRRAGNVDPVALIGLPRDRARIERIARATGAHAVPTPRLIDALALVATSDLVFTPDTSIAHAASAFRKPSVVMIGPHRADFEPYGDQARILNATTDDFKSVHAEHVVAALGEAFAEWHEARSG